MINVKILIILTVTVVWVAYLFWNDRQPVARQQILKQSIIIPIDHESNEIVDNNVKSVYKTQKEAYTGGYKIPDEPPSFHLRQIDRIQYNRGRQFGDPIRGDLPIAPCHGDWFSTTANPVLNLHPGALTCIADQTGAHQRRLNALMTKYAHSTYFADSGVKSVLTEKVC